MTHIKSIVLSLILGCPKLRQTTTSIICLLGLW